MGKFISDLYNNGEVGWFHVLPADDKEAIPYVSQYELGKWKYGDIGFKNIIPYNNSWWAIVEAETVTEAVVIFSEIYQKEVYAREFIKMRGETND